MSASPSSAAPVSASRPRRPGDPTSAPPTCRCSTSRSRGSRAAASSCASRTLTGPASGRQRAAGLRHPALAGADLGRGAGHRGPVRALPAVRAAGDLPPVRRAGCSPRTRPTTAGARRGGSRRCATSSRSSSCRPATTASATARPARRRGPPRLHRDARGMLSSDDVELHFEDLIRGRVSAPRPDDQVILKADGFPTYHLRRRRRPRDGHHPRRSRRGVDLQHAQARALYRWLGWSRRRSRTCRCCATPTSRRSPSARTLPLPDVVPGAGLPARGAGQLPRAAGLPAEAGRRGQ